MPFCLCWANENWTRRGGTGLDNEILIQQQHSAEDDINFIQSVVAYMRDERYVRLEGKPLLLVYRPSLLPSAKDTAARWRSWCRENGIGEIYLAYTQSFESSPPEALGFDAAIEFPPNNISPTVITNTVTAEDGDFWVYGKEPYGKELSLPKTGLHTISFCLSNVGQHSKKKHD